MMAELKVSGDVQPSDYEVMHLISHCNVICTASPTFNFLDVLSLTDNYPIPYASCLRHFVQITHSFFTG